MTVKVGEPSWAQVRAAFLHQSFTLAFWRGFTLPISRLLGRLCENVFKAAFSLTSDETGVRFGAAIPVTLADFCGNPLSFG